jgi:DeoR/GlpR family transcriptional regulator of sugar metabolism
LINKPSKFEAQTEIVVGKTDNFEQVFTDDEDEKEMKAQLAKERIFL